MIRLTDATNSNSLSLNPEYVVAIFVVVDKESDYVGKTGISLMNGTLIVDEEFDDVSSRVDLGIQAQRNR